MSYPLTSAAKFGAHYLKFMIPNSDLRSENSILRRRKRNSSKLIKLEKIRQYQIRREIRRNLVRIKQLEILTQFISEHISICKHLKTCYHWKKVKENYEKIISDDFAWLDVPKIYPIFNKYGRIIYGVDRRTPDYNSPIPYPMIKYINPS